MYSPLFRTLRLLTGGLVTAALLASFLVTLHAATPTWTLVGNTGSTRQYLAATSLLDGRVLIAGGYNGSGMNSAEVFSPVSNTWSPAAPMATSRFYHTMATLDDGRAFVAGGYLYPPGTALSSTEAYDPVGDAWTAMAPMGTPRLGLSGVKLDDGRVLAIGGHSGASFLVNAEVYDPVANAWAPTGSPNSHHYFATAVKLADGRALVAGGLNAATTAEVFDPTTNAWTTTSPMIRNRYFAASGLLSDGRAIVVGGVDSSSSNRWLDAEVYDPVANTWTLTTAIPGNVGGEWPSVAPRNDGQLLAVGGGNGITFPNGAALFDPATNTWTATSPMSANPRLYGFAMPIPGNRTLVGGGPTLTSEVFGSPNNVPIADAGTDQTVSGCPTCLGLAVMDASGSSDADADSLTYTWKEGATVLVVTTDPIKSTTIGLGLGVHTLTLVVTDGAGGTATDYVDVTVEDVTGTSSAELLACQTDMATLESSIVDSLALVEQHLRLEFRNPSFTIPGGSPEARLENLSNAIISLNRGHKTALYKALGGTK